MPAHPKPRHRERLRLERYQHRRDRFTITDVFTEALLGLSGRTSRLLLLVAATTLGIAALVATIGFAQTGSEQIAARIDAAKSTQATVKAPDSPDPDNPTDAIPWDADQRVERLAGVIRAGLIAKLDTKGLRISAAPLLDPTEPPTAPPLVLATTAGMLETVNGRIIQGAYFNTYHDQTGQPVAVLGVNAAERLGVTRVDNQPTIFITNTPYLVIGIVDDMERHQEMLDAIILPQTTARQNLGLTTPGDLQIHIEPGAGDILTQQAPTALNPTNPGALEVIAPPATSEFQQDLMGDIDLVFLILGAVALAIAGLSIAVVSSMSVMERRGEIGLRRALGATRTQITCQIITENTIIGFTGGLLGTTTGTITIITTAIANQWQPVLDLRIHLAALAAGTLIGLTAGLTPALKAAHLEPSTALQEGT